MNQKSRSSGGAFFEKIPLHVCRNSSSTYAIRNGSSHRRYESSLRDFYHKSILFYLGAIRHQCTAKVWPLSHLFFIIILITSFSFRQFHTRVQIITDVGKIFNTSCLWPQVYGSVYFFKFASLKTLLIFLVLAYSGILFK